MTGGKPPVKIRITPRVWREPQPILWPHEIVMPKYFATERCWAEYIVGFVVNGGWRY